MYSRCDTEKRPLDKFQPSIGFYLSLLLIFAIMTIFFGQYGLYLGLAEAFIVVVLALFSRLSAKKRSIKLMKYIESVAANTESATKGTLLNFPLPIVIFSPSSHVILWSNSRFAALTGRKERFVDVRITDLVPDFSVEWMAEGKNECPELITISNRRYKVFGSLVHTAVNRSIIRCHWVDSNTPKYMTSL